MTREHSPRPGTTWEHHLVTAEQVIADSTPLGAGDDLAPPRPNRATRRALQRATRRKARR